MGKILKSLAVGTMIGVAIGVMVMPELDRKTQRKIRKTGRRVRDAAGGAYDNLLDYVK